MGDENQRGRGNGTGQKWVSNTELQLEIKALRSDVRLWILAAVALNQFLASVDVPSSITAAALLGVVAKAIFAALFQGG